MRTTFLRVIEAQDKAAALLAAIREPEAAMSKCRFRMELTNFAAVPGSPFAYWVREELRRIFQQFPAFAAEERVARVGLQTNDDFRWIRLCWEPHAGSNNTAFPVPYAKGGRFSRFYADISLAVLWGADGRFMKAWKQDQLSQRRITANNSQCWNEGHYFRPGLTWSQRANGLSLRALPARAIFGNKGPGAFVYKDRTEHLLALLSIMNSRMFQSLIEMQLARTELAQSFDVGMIERTPIPTCTPADLSALGAIARRGWSLKRSLDTSEETSHAFVLPALLQVEGGTLAARANAWAERVRDTDAELAAVQGEIDARCYDLYGIEKDDRRSVTNDFGGDTDKSGEPDGTDVGANADDEGGAESNADAASLAAELISWSVGVVFGRFDIRLASGERLTPPEPEPFDPLPAKSPGMVPDGDPPFMPCHGVLVGDLGHTDDLAHRVTAVYERAGEPAPERDALRRALARDFFPTHIKMYSKSRRKAPIYWQLATPSASYSVWLYVHAFSKDTLFRVQNDYVAPKLAHEQRQLEGLRAEAGPNPGSAQRKVIAAHEAFVEELRAFFDEVKRVAPLWNPDLDDGVIINFAPLWRLVPHHKPWQKELKATWDALCAGAYDWAHLAMHLWPERVVPKCFTDRSLAIAHGLEDTFWFEDEDGKWKPHETPARANAELVRERSSPAVKAALLSLLDTPFAASGRRRGLRGASATNNGGGR